MDKRISVRGIIINDNKMYFIYRVKENDDYYVFPGGGLEAGETINECLVRELKEEINIEVDIVKELYRLEREDSVEYYILCKHISGVFGVSDGPEYVSLEYKNRGQYIPCTLNLNELQQYNIVPEVIKNSLFDDINKNDLKKVKFKKIYL